MLGIPPDEKMGMYRTTSAVMQFGEMKFKQRPREEQAEADGSAEAEKVISLTNRHMQIDRYYGKPEFYSGFCYTFPYFGITSFAIHKFCT